MDDNQHDHMDWTPLKLIWRPVAFFVWLCVVFMITGTVAMFDHFMLGMVLFTIGPITVALAALSVSRWFKLEA